MPTTLLMPEKRGKNGLPTFENFIEERIEGAGDIFLVSFLNGYLFYSPLSKFSMILDEFGASTVRKYFRHETLLPKEQSLIDGLVKRKVFKIPETPQRSMVKPSTRWAPTSATFSNTQKCTLRCTYCYAEGGRLEDLDIPLPVAKGAIDLIVQNAHVQNVDPSIRFLGEGEATASWGIFREIIEYYKEQCRANHFVPSISLSTNGVFASSRLDYIAENCTHLTFSLDGVREVHDEHRVLPNGGGSFDRIIATMKGLEMRGRTYDIRSTVTAAGSATLAEFVAFVGENLKCKSLHFEPVFDATNVTNLKDQIAHLDAQIFVDNFREARRVAAGFGIQLHYSAASLNHRETFCGASDASNFLVTSRGIVTSCNEVLQPSDPRAKLFQYGSWNQEDGEFVLDHEAVDRLGKLNVHDMPKCQGCIAKYNCAGDCYAKSASSTGDPASAGYTERCHITRELLKDNLLLALIFKMAGVNAGGSVQHACPM
ncbi:MAG: hypothetical protein NPIRA06_33340 [Nitrospirales bacterium]|nr:MAG: hypothetical protein NPIRA06_33340 [Nitrospirales bacterium]